MQNQNTIRKFDNTIIRSMVRGTYDLQSLRVGMGNRIVANFKAKLGLKQDGMSEKQLAKQEKAILDMLREDYKRITDGVIIEGEEAVYSKLPTERRFKGGEIISSYAELVLVEGYMNILKDEETGFKRLEKLLVNVPIYTEFLSKVDGLGVQMAGVIISEIDIHEAEYPSSLHKYCFPAGSLVSTMNGMIPIEQLKVGEKVLDIEGRNQVIKETMNKQFTGEMVTIKATGVMPITMTDDHPIMVFRNGKFSWMPAKEVIVGDYLSVPSVREFLTEEKSLYWDASERAIRVQPILADPVIIDNDFLYLCGRFVGDGSASVWNNGKYNCGVCQISFGKHENYCINDCMMIAEKVIGSAHITLGEKADNLIFGGYTVANKFQEWFGKGAANKKIPDFIMGLEDEDAIKSFLRGYFFSDGHVVGSGKSMGTIMANSISPGLIFQLQALLSKIGIFGSMHKTKREPFIEIQPGRLVNQAPYRYNLSVPGSQAHALFPLIGLNVIPAKRKVRSNEEGDWLVCVTKVSKEYVENKIVYNLHTSGTNTYQVQNIAVHNCGLDVIKIGVYTDEAGKEHTIPAWQVSEHYEREDADPDQPMIMHGKYVVKLVDEGRSRKEHALVNRVYTNKNGEEATRKSITFNPFLKTKLIGVLGGSLLKVGTYTVDGKKMGAERRKELAEILGFKFDKESDLDKGDQVTAFLLSRGYDVVIERATYGKIYDDYKNRLENDPRHQEKTPGHRHNMAIRYMVKMLLNDLYNAWRPLEGLPVAPTYAEAKLGLTHGVMTAEKEAYYERLKQA